MALRLFFRSAALLTFKTGLLRNTHLKITGEEGRRRGLVSSTLAHPGVGCDDVYSVWSVKLYDAEPKGKQ